MVLRPKGLRTINFFDPPLKVIVFFRFYHMYSFAILQFIILCRTIGLGFCTDQCAPQHRGVRFSVSSTTPFSSVQLKYMYEYHRALKNYRSRERRDFRSVCLGSFRFTGGEFLSYDADSATSCTHFVMLSQTNPGFPTPARIIASW